MSDANGLLVIAMKLKTKERHLMAAVLFFSFFKEKYIS
jgi:hypothetical protein